MRLFRPGVQLFPPRVGLLQFLGVRRLFNYIEESGSAYLRNGIGLKRDPILLALEGDFSKNLKGLSIFTLGCASETALAADVASPPAADAALELGGTEIVAAPLAAADEAIETGGYKFGVASSVAVNSLVVVNGLAYGLYLRGRGY